MNRIDRIKAKIEQIERLLAEIKKAKIERIESLLAKIKSELETLGKKAEAKHKKAHTDEPLPSDKQLRAEYENLYELYIGEKLEEIKEFLKNKSKNYLKHFCKANNLPVDTTKFSKDAIIEKVFQWMAQRKAITKKAI